MQLKPVNHSRHMRFVNYCLLISKINFLASPVHCEKLSVNRGKIIFKSRDDMFSQIWLSLCTDKDISLGSRLVISKDNNDSMNVLGYRQ